jgi:glucose-6-phosphate dehydrogenase-like protein OpcA
MSGANPSMATAAAMPGIFDALPGIETPVGSISGGLARMWEGTASEGKPSPASDSAKAIQVNFVLLLGFRTDAADAVRQFEIAVGFSRRHPSRVVVLCPLPDESGATRMLAKVYGECTVGKTPDDMRCCEFVMLSYPRGVRAHLENQVSICLSTDLPLYFWAHGFVDAAKLADYHYLMSTAKRIIIDSASAPPGVAGYPWPRPGSVRDLAFARLLPMRQSIGQFLSRYAPAALSRGLVSIRLAHGAGVAAEARVLLDWVARRMGDCGAKGEAVSLEQSAALPPQAFDLTFGFDDKRHFRWSADVAAAHANFDADFGGGRTTMQVAASFLPPEGALSEAMFF